MVDGIGRAVQSMVYRAGALGYPPTLPYSPELLRQKAIESLADEARSYIETGAGLGSTMTANRAAFDRWQIVPRMMRDTSIRDQSIELFGARYPSPFFACPVGVSELAHPEADVAVAQGCRSAQVPMVISTQASEPTEAIAAALVDSPRWFQLYWSTEDRLTQSFIRRAEDAGCSALVLTLDTAMLGWRTSDLDLGWLPFARGMGIAQYTSDPVFAALVQERLQRGPTTASEHPTRPGPGAVRTLAALARRYPGNSLSNVRSPEPRAAVETFLEIFSRRDLTWERIGWLQQQTSLPIVVKGIQHPDDAEAAIQVGAAGIIVSNHGGRQVDGAIGSLTALPGVVARVDGRVPVLFDSGIRCGADAFKALALGATAVGIGRPWVYGLALGGAVGVTQVLEGLRAELDISMALSGMTSLAHLGPQVITPAP